MSCRSTVPSSATHTTARSVLSAATPAADKLRNSIFPRIRRSPRCARSTPSSTTSACRISIELVGGRNGLNTSCCHLRPTYTCSSFGSGISSLAEQRLRRNRITHLVRHLARLNLQPQLRPVDPPLHPHHQRQIVEPHFRLERRQVAERIEHQPRPRIERDLAHARAPGCPSIAGPVRECRCLSSSTRLWISVVPSAPGIAWLTAWPTGSARVFDLPADRLVLDACTPWAGGSP